MAVVQIAEASPAAQAPTYRAARYVEAIARAGRSPRAGSPPIARRSPSSEGGGVFIGSPAAPPRRSEALEVGDQVVQLAFREGAAADGLGGVVAGQGVAE